MGTEAYKAPSTDADCCVALGRMMLAAARLESDFRVILALNRVEVGATATLGGLAKKLHEHDLLSHNGYEIMRSLKRQRSYLTHRLYDLFAARIDEDLISREELADVSLLTERAWVLEHELTGLSETAERRIADLRNGGPIGELLIRP